MATHRSAIKKNVRDEQHRMSNKMNRTKMKNRIKVFMKKLNEGQTEEAKALFPQVISRIDTTIRKGIIHKNTGIQPNTAA